MAIAYVPKPTILASLPLDRHAVIEASAGTGKTYTLEHLVIELLLTTDVTLDRLLVVTFTEKAAAELRARLRGKMTELLEAPPCAPPAEGQAWAIDESAKKKLSRALLSFDAASISTIHAFCQRVLAENAFESGRHFEQDLVDGRSTFERAFYTVLRKQIANVEAERRFLDAWLASRKLEQLVALLWDAHEKRGRFEPAYDEPLLLETLSVLAKMDITPHALRPAMVRAEMHPQTVQAILERLAIIRRALEDHHRTNDLPKLLSDLESQESKKRGNFLTYAIEKLEAHVTEEGKLKELEIALTRLKVCLVGFESAVCQRFLPVVQAELAAQKAKHGELDFDDMLTLLAESLEGANGAAMIASLRQRFSYALIDEFQDTDEVQWSVFSKVFLDSAQRSILYVIGDPKQAIYGFRGADVQTYLEARQRIDAAGGQRVHLTESFRATSDMVDGLNEILDDEAPTRFFSGEIRYDHPVTCGRPTAPGLRIDGHVVTPVRLFELVPRDEKFHKIVHARQTHAQAIAKEITVLLDSKRTTYLDEPLPAKEIFVLTRSAKEGTEVADALREREIPHAFYKQDGLFQTREANDIRDLLAAIADPLHESRRLRAWHSPFFAVSVDRLPDLRDLPGAHRLMKLLLDWKSLAEDKQFDRLYSSVLEETGLIERELFLSASERELTNYLHIFEVLIEEVHTSSATLAELLYTLDGFIRGRRAPPGEDGNVQRIASDRPAVQIMTMHKAKGLEAAVVFLYGGFDEPHGSVRVHHQDRRRLLHVGPAAPPSVAREAEEENQRLLYVALTRAKARVYLPYVGFKNDAEGRPERTLERMAGTHRQLNDRFDALLDGQINASLFSVEPAPEPDRRHLRVVEGTDEVERLREWTVPPDLARPVVPPPDFERLRAAHIGFDVTSYSRIKAEKGGYRPPEGLLEEEIAVDVHGTTQLLEDDVLPSGPATGRFLHEMLELVSLEVLRANDGLDLFSARRDVRELVIDGLRRYDLDTKHLAESLDLVYTALTGPIALAESVLNGVANSQRVVREMEFLYPYGELGFVKGYIDLVFEHDGRVYVLDWKSDLLPAYDKETIDRHVGNNYALQARLYSVAIAKLFAMNDEETYERLFGGAVYCFIRGMAKTGDGSAGVYFSRPSFAELQSYAETPR